MAIGCGGVSTGGIASAGIIEVSPSACNCCSINGNPAASRGIGSGAHANLATPTSRAMCIAAASAIATGRRLPLRGTPKRSNPVGVGKA